MKNKYAIVKGNPCRSASIAFLRALFGQIEETLGGLRRVRLRMDGAFFREEVLRLVRSRGAGYAIKVPFWRCLDLKVVIGENRRWGRVGRGVYYLEHRLDMWGMECGFRGKAATDSDGKRPPIPIDSGH